MLRDMCLHKVLVAKQLYIHNVRVQCFCRIKHADEHMTIDTGVYSIYDMTEYLYESNFISISYYYSINVDILTNT